EDAVSIKDLAQAFALGRRLGADHVTLVEEERTARRRFEDEQLAFPARVTDETDDVAEETGRADLAGEDARARVERLFGLELAHDEEVGRGREHREAPLPSLHAQRGRLSERSGDALRVDLDPLLP